MRIQLARLVMIGAMVASVAGCDSLGLGDEESLSVSFAVPRTTTSGSQSFSVLAIPVTVNGHTLDLQTVEVTFQEITLERAENSRGGDSDGDSDSDSDSDGEANENLQRSGLTVSLPLTGGIITPINESIPNGTYEEIELDIGTVRLRGTFDGQPFDVTLFVDAELESEFSPPFIVDSNDDRLNITVQIDPSLWLRTSDGNLIDPRVLTSNSSLRQQVIARIERSFKAFEDSDRDADDSDSDSDSDGR